jgi:hypothetical protein
MELSRAPISIGGACFVGTSMATVEDRAHLERLLKEHKKRLRLLELRQARQGDAIEAATAIEIDDIRAAIADIEQHTPSTIVNETRAALRNQYDNDIDFLIADGAARNRRQTRNEERTETLAVEQHAIGEKGIMLVSDVQTIADRLVQNESKGRFGRTRNAVLLIINVVMLAWILATLRAHGL